MKDVRSRLGGLEVHVKEILTLLRAKGKKVHENTNSYLNRKKRKRKEEDARRQDRQKNPEGSPFEWGAVESNRVVDHFVRKERTNVLLMLQDQEHNHAVAVLELLLRFWLDWYWEQPVRVSGAGFSTFTGWTLDREGRDKPKRQLIRPCGDVLFLCSKFGMGRPWDGTKSTKVGEPLMWRLVCKLVHRLEYRLQYDDEMEVRPEWAEVNPDALKVLEFLGGGGWSFNDNAPGDKLYIQRPFTLWEFNRDLFHKKIGKIMPLLASVSAAFERAVRQASS